MSRTSAFKILYFGTLFGLASAILWLTFGYGLGIFGSLMLFLCLLIPGRLLGYFWRDLVRGLRLLNEERFDESKKHSERFLFTLEQRPWLKHFIWLGSSTYSRNPKCLALNNLGAAEIGLGDLSGARTHLLAAIEEDRSCPLPVFNMGALALAEGEPEEEVAIWFDRAAALGYSRGLIDSIIASSQARFARRECQ